MDKQEALIRQLKKQVKDLQKREAQAKQQMKLAVKKANQLGKSYKSRLLKKIRLLTNRVANAEAAAYIKAVAKLERDVLKKLESKSDLLKKVVKCIEASELGKAAKCMLDGDKKPKKRKVVKKKSKKA